MSESAFFAAAVATIFSVVDPVGIAPLFLALTPGIAPGERLRVMRRAIIVSAVILFLFAAGGRTLLQFLGITVPAFSIAGGILLLLISIDMLFARLSRTRETPEEEQEAQESTDVSVFPLAIPIISGPGAIATVILYMAQAGTDIRKILAVVAAIVISLVASYVSMRASGLVLRVLGSTGVHVVGRVMGILLAALAVQFILNGVGQYYHHTLSG
ncbi:MAG: MarC family protein [Thermomicrobia bacterium]|nr:MarC family protein [Thermomicrobia bacterium]